MVEKNHQYKEGRQIKDEKQMWDENVCRRQIENYTDKMHGLWWGARKICSVIYKQECVNMHNEHKSMEMHRSTELSRFAMFLRHDKYINDALNKKKWYKYGKEIVLLLDPFQPHFPILILIT